MDFKTFKTIKEAKAVVATWLGWEAYITSLYLPDDKNARQNGFAYVIRSGKKRDDYLYLRDDGFIR